MFLPTSASSTMRPVMMDGSSPTVADSSIAMNTKMNCSQYGFR